MACVCPGCSPSERLISRVGVPARSKTPSADMERSVYGADCTRSPVYLSKVNTPLGCSGAQTSCNSAANGVAGFPLWGGAWRRGQAAANGTQPERLHGGSAARPSDRHPQLCEFGSLRSAAASWPSCVTAPA